jgi:hypothetical protein
MTEEPIMFDFLNFASEEPESRKYILRYLIQRLPPFIPNHIKFFSPYDDLNHLKILVDAVFGYGIVRGTGMYNFYVQTLEMVVGEHIFGRKVGLVFATPAQHIETCCRCLNALNAVQ